MDINADVKLGTQGSTAKVSFVLAQLPQLFLRFNLFKVSPVVAQSN